jgi:hypothetical protein
MKVVNLTNEGVTIITPSSNKITFPPSGLTISPPQWVFEKCTSYPYFYRIEDEGGDKFLLEKKIVRLSFTLPKREKGVLYIVDMNTLALITLFTDRADFFFVEDGKLCRLQRKKNTTAS